MMQDVGRLERDGHLSSDEQHRIAASIQDETDRFCTVVDAILEAKQKRGAE